jgi:hypothetical protein
MNLRPPLALTAVSVLLLTSCMPVAPGGPQNASSSQSSLPTDPISVSEPLPYAVVTSPLVLKGRARGTWYFEASFPVKLLDANGQVLAFVPAEAQRDWMTEDFVPYQAVITFAPPQTATGMLVLQKDNPSGEPQYDASISVPVKF